MPHTPTKDTINRRALLLTAMAGATALVAAPLLTNPVMAKKPSTYTSGGAAVGGYDPVAYFKQGKAVKGSSKHATKYKGATYRFASAENLKAFKASPARYAPQFGGYCAWAVSQGYTAHGDPRAWSVVGGKLYLNYNSSVRSKWKRNASSNIKKGRANWPKVLN